MQISILELELENGIRYFRQTLSFHSGFAPDLTVIHLPEIDKLELLQPILSSQSYEYIKKALKVIW